MLCRQEPQHDCSSGPPQPFLLGVVRAWFNNVFLSVFTFFSYWETSLREKHCPTQESSLENSNRASSHFCCTLSAPDLPMFIHLWLAIWSFSCFIDQATPFILLDVVSAWFSDCFPSICHLMLVLLFFFTRSRLSLYFPSLYGSLYSFNSIPFLRTLLIILNHFLVYDCLYPFSFFSQADIYL